MDVCIKSELWMRRKGKKERKEKFVSIASQINIGHLFLVLSIKQSYIQVESCKNKRLTICRICVIIDLLRPAKSTNYFFWGDDKTFAFFHE